MAILATSTFFTIVNDDNVSIATINFVFHCFNIKKIIIFIRQWFEKGYFSDEFELKFSKQSQGELKSFQAELSRAETELIFMLAVRLWTNEASKNRD